MALSPRPRCSLFVVVTLASISLSPADASETVFVSFAGAWSGPGTIVMNNGQTQQIACRLTNAVDAQGTRLDQSLNCTSDSTQLQLTASYAYAGGAVSGNWSDAIHGKSGNLSGQARSGRIQATIAGLGFVGALSISAQGKQQNVVLQAQGGGDIKKMSINLHKV